MVVVDAGQGTVGSPTECLAVHPEHQLVRGSVVGGNVLGHAPGLKSLRGELRAFIANPPDVHLLKGRHAFAAADKLGGPLDLVPVTD